MATVVTKHWRIDANEGYSYVDEGEGDGKAVQAAIALRQYLRDTGLDGHVYVFPYKCMCSYCGGVLKGQDEMERMVFALVSGRAVEDPNEPLPINYIPEHLRPTMPAEQYVRLLLTEVDFDIQRSKYEGFMWQQMNTVHVSMNDLNGHN